MKRLVALVALTILTACDNAERADFRNERADQLYKSAMEDYRSGRIDAAIESFRKSVAKDPANASARFQLACLLQDVKCDYLGAFCGYREFLSQHPGSDKAKMAESRLAKCELELAKFLAEKHGLVDKDRFVKENAAMKAELQAAEEKAAKAEKEVAALQTRVAALTAERGRLLAVIKGDSGESPLPSSAAMAKEAKDLLEEEEDVDRISLSADAAALKAETAAEVSTESDFLPAQSSVTNAVRLFGAEKKPKVEPRQIPETYVVQEGDTLYGIAKRFYGRLSAWKRIRDANKAWVSTDGRVRVGDTLRLPKE